LASQGCYQLVQGDGGGDISAAVAAKDRVADPADVAVPPGYRVEVVANGLTFPTGVTFGDRGEVYVVESGLSMDQPPIKSTPRILEITAAGPREVVRGSSHGHWSGVFFHGGAFFVTQAGEKEGGGRVVRIDRDGGTEKVLVDNLPSFGDHHVNAPTIGPDGKLYFAVGTFTNSGVVGEDNAELGWLKKHPQGHDIPCQDVKLKGVNFDTENPLTEGDDEVTTGVFMPFGTPSQEGQLVRGQLPCNGAIMRVSVDGGPIELVAWGFRNPYGMAFAPNGMLYATDNGMDQRGSRPVFGSADALWQVQQGRWYGWPDYSEGRPLAWEWWYSERDGETKGFMLATHPGTPPQPAAYFPVHSSADGIDFSRSASFGHVGDAFVALFGDQTPFPGKVMDPVGFKVVRVEMATGHIEDFMKNPGNKRGPATHRGDDGLERPLGLRFDPSGNALYVVDFGIVRQDPTQEPQPGTGVLWRVTKGG
jgi:glucose/arabinose dehydrogenase